MSASNDRRDTQASFNQAMVTDLQNRLRNNNGAGMAACHGHSHPAQKNNPYHQNFSLGDLTTYM